MKFTHFALATVFTLPLLGETVYTVPQGYTKVDIAPSTGAAKLTSISVTLLQDVAFAGSAARGIFVDNVAPTPDTQPLTVSNVTWTATQWTAEPHIAYISVADDPGNADGIAPAEEAFLIVGNTTTGGLTVQTPFDLASKFPASTTVKIRKAHTVSSVLNSLASGSATFQSADRVFVWNGSGWQSLRFLSGSWRDADSPATIVNGMVIFPDEGIFVQRTGTGTMTLTLFGEVPAAPQIATIEGTGFLSNRYPVATTLADLGLQSSNWQSADRVYIWNGTNWLSNRYLTNSWRDADSPATLTGATVISANTAVFVSRSLGVTPTNGSVTTPFPANYNID